MRNLRPEQINSRASKASDADSPQRLRACVEAVSHRQRRSTNPPRLKSSAGKGKPGQHTNNRTVTHRPSNRLIPGWLQTKPRLQHRQLEEAPPHWGYLCSPTHQHRAKHLPHKWNIRNKWNTRNHSSKETPKPFAKQNTNTLPPQHNPKTTKHTAQTIEPNPPKH